MKIHGLLPAGLVLGCQAILCESGARLGRFQTIRKMAENLSQAADQSA